MKIKIIKRTLAFMIAMIILVCDSLRVSAAAIRTATTGSQTLSNGVTVSGSVSQFSSYMYGNTSCSNVGTSKRVINTYYYYSGSTLIGKSDTSAYVLNGFEGYSHTTNFIAAATGKVAGIKGQHYVKSSSTVIWSDSCWAGTVS